MAEIAFKFSAGADIVQKEKDIERQLWNIYQSVEGVKGSLSVKLKNTSQINWQLQQILQQLESEKSKVNSMHCGMSTIMEKYQSTEEGIVGAAWAGIGADDATQQTNTGADQKEETNGWLELLKKLLGEMGAVGNLPLLFVNWKNGDGFGGLNNLTKIVGSAASSVKNNGIKWKKLFGIPELSEFSNAGSSWKSWFSHAAKNELGDYVFDATKTGAQACADKVKVFTKWAGSLLAVAESGYNNYQEHGGVDNPRFWQEFATESAIDLAKGALIGVAVGAGAAGVATLTAPAWLVGVGVSVVTIGGSAGLDWGLDYIAQKVTGDSQAEATEVLSDAIWDYAIPWLQDTGKNISDAFGNAASAVSGWLKEPKWAF